MGGEPVHLDVCFRSTPEIVNLANRVFERLMPPSSRPFEFEYGRMEHSDQRADDRGSIELIVVDREDRTARTEAELIAGRIRSMVDDGDKTVYWDGDDHLATPRPVRFGDMTILLRARTNLRFLEWALNRAGIPYHIHAGLGFYESQEVLDACNILSFLANERNDVALYGLLRSPYFAFSDEDLYRVSRSGHGSLWHSLNGYAGDPEDGRFEEASNLIGSWLKMAHRIPVSELLPRIVADSGIYAVYGGTVEGEQAIANVEKLMGIARNAREQGFSSLSRFMGWFDRAIREAPKEGHASLDLDSGDCVNIMTIHAAKGLEFPVVFVPEMSNLPWGFGDLILVDRELGLGTKVPDPDDSYRMKDACARRIIKRRNEEKERAEYRRLLYVAMTRAKDHLVVSGREPEKYPMEMKDDGSWMELFLASTEIIEGDVEAGEKRVEAEGSIVPMNILRGRDIPDIGLEVEREPLRPDDHLLKAIAASATDHPPRPQKERVLTASAIDQYMRCPRRFKAIHEMGLPEERIGTSATDDTPARTGKIIHEVFRGNDPTAVLRRFGIDDPERAREYGEMRKRFLESDLMGDMVDERCELPIRFREGEHTYKGTVDRLVRTDEGWRIIDYKTGDVKPSELEKRAKEYAIQMAIYAKGVRRLLGVSPRVMIYFPTCDRSQEVVMDEDIPATVATLVRMVSRSEFDFEECAGCSRHSAKETLHDVCPALKSLGIDPSED